MVVDNHTTSNQVISDKNRRNAGLKLRESFPLDWGYRYLIYYHKKKLLTVILVRHRT